MVVGEAPPPAVAATAPVTWIELLDRAPTVLAARHRFSAAESRIRLAGVLPDPMVSASYMTIPGSMPMNSLAVEVEQGFPRWGERDAERDQALATMAMARAAYAAARGRTAAAFQSALIERRSAIALATLNREIAQRARILADLLTRSAVAVGKASVREPLSLESRATEAELMASQESRMAADAAGMAAATVGLPPDAELPDFPLPDLASVAVAQAPEIAMARARMAMAAADERMARARGRPMVTVFGRWQQEGEEDRDAWEGGLRVSIPLWRSAYAGAVAAADLDRSAAQSDAAGALRDAEELLARTKRAIDQAARTRRWAEATSLRLAHELEALVAESASGMAGATAMLFDRFDELAQAQRADIAAAAEGDRARAGLWTLAPPPLIDTGIRP
ncbi:hypothetical protein LBMAG53_33640 [Planctomycetota bacterium]|nr:hypothetical protein LBMAG53_33640 [Planctomycetota bacterium]